MLKSFFSTTAFLLSFGSAALAISPNPLLTRGLKAYTSSGDVYNITDGDLTNWKYCSANDIAINVGEGPQRLFVTWESLGDCAWANYASGCGHNGTPLGNFKVLTSANSTDGQDGDWQVAAQIVDNPVMSRGVYIDFAGMSWFRFVSDGEVGQILEIEAYDVTRGNEDTWFFMGTSISQMGLKQQDTDSTTANIIHGRFPGFTPAMLRGGIGCINSSDVLAHIDDYLRYAGNVKHWAIEMGTNDAWGGGDWNIDNFRRNMQTIIDSAKANGIEPVLARIIATNEEKAGWQINQKFLDVIDELTEVNNLIPGPDFFNYFLQHPELIGSDGVHPNGETRGGQAMHHLWAEALAPIYADSQSDDDTDITGVANVASVAPVLTVSDRVIRLQGIDVPTSLDVVSVSGRILEHHDFAVSQDMECVSQVPAGIYVVRVKWQGGVASYKVHIGYANCKSN